MPKKKDFDKIEHYVIETLENYEYTRDDDMLLYYYVCKAMVTKRGGEFTEPSFFEVATKYKEFGFPTYESVRRSRCKVVNELRPDLQSAERRKIRQAQIPDYVEYAISENTLF